MTDLDTTIDEIARIRKNIRDRTTAEGVFLELEKMWKNDDGQRFWDVLHRLIEPRLPVTTASRKRNNQQIRMSDIEAKNFELVEMPFGKYVGKQVGETPMEYLDWLAEEQFSRRLREYCRSNVAKERRQ